MDRKKAQIWVIVLVLLTLALGSAVSVQPAASAVTGTYFDHVVIIVMENEGVGDICHQTPPPCLTSGSSGSAASPLFPP